MIWGDFSCYVNGGNVLGCVAYKNIYIYIYMSGGGGGGGGDSCTSDDRACKELPGLICAHHSPKELGLFTLSKTKWYTCPPN